MSIDNLDRYINDPEIINEPMPLREIHAIRIKIYDETKNMTVDERKSYYSDGLDEICRKHSIEIVPSAKRV
jgi:hypothetical protein